MSTRNNHQDQDSELTVDPNVKTDQKVLFDSVTTLFEKIAKAKGGQKSIPLRPFFESWRKTRGDIFPFMRLLLPKNDADRGMYNLKESKLAVAFSEVISPGTDTATAIKDWKNPIGGYRTTGSLAERLYEVVKGRVRTLKPKVTIAEVNRKLDELQQVKRPGNKNQAEEARAVLDWFYSNCTAVELKWLVRVILRDIKIGVTETTVLKEFHPDAIDLFSSRNDLKSLCATLYDPKRRVATSSVQPFTPFFPERLSKAVSFSRILDTMKSKPFWIETKLDGNRMLIHRVGNEYKYFTRRFNEETPQYGAYPSQAGTFTSEIHDQFDPKYNSFIIDGEMMAYDSKQKTFLPLTEVRKFASREIELYEWGEMNNEHLCFVAFDIVYANGRCFLSEPREQRYLVLKDLIRQDKPDWIRVLDHTEGNTVVDLITALNDHVTRNEEGIVVKCRKSRYFTNVSPVAFKIKPNMVGDMYHDLDLLVLGANYGTGRRGGILSTFVLGVIDDERSDTDLNHPVFTAFSRVGTGYSLRELEDIVAGKDVWKRYDPDSPPPFLNIPNSTKIRPDVYIDYHIAPVLAVRAFEIIPSNEYVPSPGFTLRFPRVQERRLDKDWRTVETTSNIVQQAMRNGGKLASIEMMERAVFHNELKDAKKVKGKNQRSRRDIKLMPRFLPQPLKKNAIKSALFEGKEFCVKFWVDEEVGGKTGLEQLIVDHGGTRTQNPKEGATFAVVSDKLALNIKSMVKSRQYDVVKSKWVLESIQAGKCLPLYAKYTLGVTERTERSMNRIADEFGDPYYEDCKPEDVEFLFSRMDASKVVAKYRGPDYVPDPLPKAPGHTELADPLVVLMADIEDRYFDKGTRYKNSLFRHCVVYLDLYEELRIPHDAGEMDLDDGGLVPGKVIRNSWLDIYKSDLLFYGGQVSEYLSPHCTHVVVYKKDLSRVAEIREYLGTLTPRPHFVTHEWLTESVAQGRMLYERDYLVPLSTE